MVGWSGHETFAWAVICVGFSACTPLKDGSVSHQSSTGGGGAGASAGQGGQSAGNAGSSGSASGSSNEIPDDGPRCSDPLPTTGVTYYACACGKGADPDCAAGSEEASGTDPASPLLTVESLRQRFSLLQDGDAVAFCRGGSFKVENEEPWVNTGCGEARCSIRDYDAPWASGDEPAPIIDAWGRTGMAIGASGYQIVNLAISNGYYGVHIKNGDDGRLCGLKLDGLESGVRLDSEQSFEIRLEQSTYTDIAGAAIWLPRGWCEECAISSNHFERVVMHPTGLDKSVAAIEIQSSTRLLLIEGNEFRGLASRDPYDCRTDAIAIEGSHSDLRVADNRVEVAAGKAAPECAALAINRSTLNPGAVSSAVVMRNRFRNLGTAFIDATNCLECRFESNLLIQERSPVDPLEAKPLATRPFFFLGTSPKLTLLNNTVYFGDRANAEGSTGVFIEGEDNYELRDWVWSNNLIVFRGQADYFSCFQAFGAWQGSFLRLSDNNACHAPRVMLPQWANGYPTLSAWQAASAFDAASLDVDPGLIEEMGDDFLRPRAPDSELIGKGSAMNGAKQDLDGTKRHSPPDIGAREHLD